MDSSEEHRHRSEVRYWIGRRVENGKEWLRGTLEDIERRRGRAAANRLRYDIAAEWAAGNRGEPGDWRQEEEADAHPAGIDIVPGGEALLDA
jgi:hypothetical protein